MRPTARMAADAVSDDHAFLHAGGNAVRERSAILQGLQAPLSPCIRTTGGRARVSAQLTCHCRAGSMRGWPSSWRTLSVRRTFHSSFPPVNCACSRDIGDGSEFSDSGSAAAFTSSFYFKVGHLALSLLLYPLRACAPAMVGPDARVDCEPGQVRKEAAISMFSPVPSVARPWAGRIAKRELRGRK